MKTFQSIRMTVLAIQVALFAGCATYPMGLTRDQWEALPPDRQAEYRAQQHAMDEARRQQAAEARLERERQMTAMRLAEQERLQHLYAHARYGDIVRVAIQGGALEIYNRRHSYHPVSFELAKGETKLVQVTWSGQVQQSVSFPVRLSEDGLTVYFNEGRHDRIVLVNRNWENGQTYRPRTSGQSSGLRLVDATFFVKYTALPGAPQRVIIEHR